MTSSGTTHDGAADAGEAGRGDPFRLAGRRNRRKIAILAAAALLLAATSVTAVAVGASGISLRDVGWALWTRALGITISTDELATQTVVWELRLPRVGLAVAAGAGLAVAGVVLQGLLRNPMVSPFTLGISSAAAFGASLTILFGDPAGRGSVGMVASALGMALLCAGLLLGLSWLRQASPVTLILVGTALTYLFQALTSTMQYIASENQLAEIVRWSFGSVNAATWAEVVAVGVPVLVATALLIGQAGNLNAIAFAGDDAARSLGVHVPRTRLICSLLAVMLAAVIVSFTGVIGFVGLVAPHIARLLIGADHRFLLPFAALAGALLVLAADTAGRTLFSPAVIPVGIVVAFLGAPLFINLILTRRRQFL
ncbi:FecCD family ABC transporter permease [Parafrankia elaeagni]|uniref:FecCD family ABC transporter permease n=1 Tax=Parafrankia elaeagni TaxID=222534 RepID=UPI000376BE58|nr:iron ABC transporter permease [Parafrankia elaeagni]